MFHHILVAVDGSTHANRALEEAIDSAHTQRADLTILSAVPHPSVVASLAGTVAVPLADELHAEFAGILRRAAEAVPDDISVQAILSEEPVREALGEQLETGRFDLLVMGSRGRGAVRATFLGSVSHHLLNHSSIPVLVMHAEGDTPQDTECARAASAPS